EQDQPRALELKLLRLLSSSNILNCIGQKDNVAVKMHFGEEGNTGYVHPPYLRIICDAINKRGARPFLSDTNTLYRGRRINSKDHLKLADEHGFTTDAVGAQVIIPDETKKENVAELKINQKFIKTAKLLKIYLEADAIVGVAHFKGHIMTGFAGALKNLGMGCAAREGKLAQHSDISPAVILKNCTGCNACVQACPVKAISLIDKKSNIDNAKCIGCASCIAACNFSAIEVNWAAGGGTIQEKMIEYTKAVLKGKEKKSAFINFALKITKECDCLAKDDPRISPDVGILLSVDPVSIDKASLDLVNKACARDIFKEAHPERDGNKQLYYAQALGLGSLEYELISVE
ncbi:MAG: DUF362 domain-containing protein, partial [Candidatus Omnitrophica bacterium]|nr:DUF362 domain-containing protein [Candidatus Omnitrophota bacterium]